MLGLLRLVAANEPRNREECAMERLSYRRAIRFSWPGFLAIAMISGRPIPTAAQTIIALPSVSAGTPSIGTPHDTPPNLVAPGMLRGAIEAMA
jgi:hypothetical protein